MNEEKENWEQPEIELGSQSGEEEAVMHESEAEKGETIGKFKDVQALYDAYNNLEKEFTKKSQRLAELEKEKTKEADIQEENLDEKLASFLSSNGEAGSYASRLKEIVNDDIALKSMDDPFGYAWAKVCLDNLKAKQNSDLSAVGNYVLGNSAVKDMVIKNYISQLENNSSPIRITSGGNRMVNSPMAKPKTFKEAKNVLTNLFS